MNISAVNMNSQAFGKTFNKGDVATNEFPTDVAPDVADNETVYISLYGGGDWAPYTAGQFRADQAARKALEEKFAEEEAAKQAQREADAAKFVDNRPDSIKYWNY